MRVDHVGIAVRSIAAARALWGRLLQLSDGEVEELPAERVRVAFLQAGPVWLELLEPVGAEGPLARFLATRGEGLHHIAFEVDDIARALVDAQQAGCRPVDGAPRRGSRGRLVAFLHPKDTLGVLIEFVQRRDV